MQTLSEKCSKYVSGSIRVGGKLAIVDLSNRLIAKYQQVFGEGAYQLLKLENGKIMSIMGVSLLDGSIIIFGKETTYEKDRFIYGETICAEVSNENHVKIIESALIKMLYAIKRLS
jgi:hypothetical protein